MSGATDVAAFPHAVLAPEQGDAHLTLLQRECETERAAFELDDLLAAHVSQAGDHGDTVADSHHAAGIEQLLDTRLRRARREELAKVRVGVAGIKRPPAVESLAHRPFYP